MRSDDYLAGRALTVGTTVDAKKTKMSAAEAVRLARTKRRVVVAKGKNVVVFDLAASPPPDDAALSAALMGPSGNLRAPTLVVGDTLLVGFNDAAYAAVFGTRPDGAG